LAALKWLLIRSSQFREDKELSVFLTDSVFGKILSLLQLEYFKFYVENARVTTREHFDHTLILKYILLQRLRIELCFIFSLLSS
jgi:hypothetical protein